MKIIKYKICNRVNNGTEEAPKWEEVLYPVEVHCTSEHLAANEAIAQKEAYDGKYTIEDDGQPEPEAQPTDAERIAELEEALDMLLNGVTE